MSEAEPAEFSGCIPYHIDALPQPEGHAFVLGVEWEITHQQIRKTAGEFVRTVHTANVERLQRLAWFYRRESVVERYDDEWSFLTVRAGR